MIFPISFVVCLLFFSLFSKAELVVKHYQRQFKLKFFGSLTNDQEVLFSGEGNTYLTAVNQCSEFCRRDRRCIGMELCKISEDRIRCRVCCKTKREEEGIPLNNTDKCRYMAMVRCNFIMIFFSCLSEIEITILTPSNLKDITIMTEVYVLYLFFSTSMYKG